MDLKIEFRKKKEKEITSLFLPLSVLARSASLAPLGRFHSLHAARLSFPPRMERLGPAQQGQQSRSAPFFLHGPASPTAPLASSRVPAKQAVAQLSRSSSSNTGSRPRVSYPADILGPHVRTSPFLWLMSKPDTSLPLESVAAPFSPRLACHTSCSSP